MRTHYENLKITRTASNEEIRRAYRLLAQKWHPDKNTHRTEEAESNIKIINEAYRVLSDTELRQDHDAWIRKNGNAPTTEPDASDTFDDPGRRQYKSRDDYFAEKRKRSKRSKDSYIVSKKAFRRVLMAVVGIPAVLGVVALSVNRFPDLIHQASVVTVKKSSGVSAGADVNREIEKGLYDFFSTTNQTLLLITDTDTAIAALPGLERSMNRLVVFADQLASADSTTKFKTSNAVAVGLRRLEPQIARLRNDSRIWAVLYPTVKPMLRALRRLAA